MVEQEKKQKKVEQRAKQKSKGEVKSVIEGKAEKQVEWTEQTEQAVEQKKGGINGQTIAIIALGSVLAIVLIGGAVLFGMGVIKVGDGEAWWQRIGMLNNRNENRGDGRSNNGGEKDGCGDGTKNNTKGETKCDVKTQNPNPRVRLDERLVEIDDLEFYVPDEFTSGGVAGGGDEKVYTYNLTDNDGWADIKIYVEKTSKDARDYLKSKNDSLKIKNEALVVNGWSWSEASNGSVSAWATNYGDYVYAIVLAVKIDSDETDDAVTMIPKTLYFEEIYK